MTNSDSFDAYLSKYQEDMLKIISKHRRHYHKLSVEEIISEANLLLLKGKDKIIDTLGEEFNENNFKKMAYAYVKNCISWSNHEALNSKRGKMQSKILDSMHSLDDGEPVTTFELAMETVGKDDELEIFSSKDGLKNFIHVLTQYYYLLSDNETKILSYMQKGMNQYEMSAEMGVTRQAISFALIGLKEKVSSQFNFRDIYNENSNTGQKALDSLFSK